jgi:predicted acetyltransferase
MSLTLRPFTVEDEEAAMRGHLQLRDSPYIDFLVDYNEREHFAVWVERMVAHSEGRDLPEGWVRGSFLAIVVNEIVVGRISVRHELNDYLAEYGGHIGYAVLPEYRRRGYATCSVRQALKLLADAGVNRVLISCDNDNTNSVAVIENVGGVFESLAVRQDGIVKRRYWLAN